MLVLRLFVGILSFFSYWFVINELIPPQSPELVLVQKYFKTPTPFRHLVGARLSLNFMVRCRALGRVECRSCGGPRAEVGRARRVDPRAGEGPRAGGARVQGVPAYWGLHGWGPACRGDACMGVPACCGGDDGGHVQGGPTCRGPTCRGARAGGCAWW